MAVAGAGSGGNGNAFKPKGAYEDSRRKLSKIVAELERRLNEEEKKNLILTNRLLSFKK